MELPDDTKRQLLESLIAQAERERYTQITMGQVWTDIGNAQAVERCAKDAEQASKVIAALQKKLDAIPCTEPSQPSSS